MASDVVAGDGDEAGTMVAPDGAPWADGYQQRS